MNNRDSVEMWATSGADAALLADKLDRSLKWPLIKTAIVAKLSFNCQIRGGSVNMDLNLRCLWLAHSMSLWPASGPHLVNRTSAHLFFLVIFPDKWRLKGISKYRFSPGRENIMVLVFIWIISQKPVILQHKVSSSTPLKYRACTSQWQNKSLWNCGTCIIKDSFIDHILGKKMSKKCPVKKTERERERRTVEMENDYISQVCSVHITLHSSFVLCMSWCAALMAPEQWPQDSRGRRRGK